MKIRYLIILFIGLTIICFVSVYLLTLPAFLERFNLTTTSNIGSTIGGITAPVLGIISSLLLFIALIKQTTSEEKTRLKNESDIIFLLINQLDTEYNKFYYKFTQNKGNEKNEFIYKGTEGMNEFINSFCYKSLNINCSWSELFQAKQISLLIKSFILIDKKIDSSQLDDSLKDLFQDKLKAVYICKFQEEIKLILNKCAQSNMSDILVEEMKDFYNYYEKKYKK